MRILGLETSSLYGSIAAADDSELLLSQPLTRERRTAQSLAPAVAQLLRELKWKASDLDVVAVTAGPGSFTGLRIGVTTAKTLAFAAEARLIGVDTLAALAEAANHEVAVGEAILPLIDAHRNQLFTARYRKQADGSLLAETPVEIIEIDQWLAGEVPAAVLTGPLLRKIGSEVQEAWPSAKRCPESLWTPSATAVVLIAQRKAVTGEFDDAFKLLPQYYRPSYAEEKRR